MLPLWTSDENTLTILAFFSTRSAGTRPRATLIIMARSFMCPPSLVPIRKEPGVS